MEARHAIKLKNHDEVVVRVDGWCLGYVLGTPYKENDEVIVPVQSKKFGFVKVSHVDIQ
jgi:hypothetical protein